MQTTTFLAILVSTASASVPTLPKGPYGYYPVSLCAYNASELLAFTNNSITAGVDAWAVDGRSTTWIGKQLAIGESCQTPLTPTTQSIPVKSFSRAQVNYQWFEDNGFIMRSKIYALSVFRPDFVGKTYLEFDITDATGKLVVPRMKITLRGSSEIIDTMLAAKRRSATAPTKPHRGKRGSKGRRKGKAGIMGGIGGGTRYGGGSGGFKSSTPGGSTKTYGYSSSALHSRYALLPGGYTRTSYGYSGLSTVYVGAPMFLYARGGGGHYSQSCNRYTGNSRSQCLRSYNGTTNSDGLNWKANSVLIRDDLMAATVDTRTTKFPLNVTIYKAVVVFEKGGVNPWDQPLLLSFSEVDLDDEDDVILEFWVFCLLVSIGIVLCCCFCIWWWCSCRSSKNDSYGDSSSKECDLENPKPYGHCAELSTPAVGMGEFPGHPIEVNKLDKQEFNTMAPVVLGYMDKPLA